MSCPEYEDRLNDYAGGYLSGRARQEVDEHLLVCVACREEVHALKALLGDLAGLPREIEAPEEIWQATAGELRGRMDPARPGAGPAREAERAWSRWVPLAVAASAVLVAALALMVAVSQPAPGPAPEVAAGDAVPEGVARVEVPAFGEAEEEFKMAADELLAALEARRDRLPPRTLAVIQKNLKAINDAIEETREAMESDPDNADLGGLMRAMYRRKLNLLQGVSEIPAS